VSTFSYIALYAWLLPAHTPPCCVHVFHFDDGAVWWCW